MHIYKSIPFVGRWGDPLSSPLVVRCVNLNRTTLRGSVSPHGEPRRRHAPHAHKTPPFDAETESVCRNLRIKKEHEGLLYAGLALFCFYFTLMPDRLRLVQCQARLTPSQ